MLTPDEIERLKYYAGEILTPVNDYIINDICKRIVDSGKFTRTAEYLTYRAQALGMDFETLKKEIAKRLNVSINELEALFKQAAKQTARMDYETLSKGYVDFEHNASLQNIVKASINLAQQDFTNITQTIGMVAPTGENLPLKDFYQSTMDWVFNNVSTGVMDYNTAVRKASNTLSQKGLTKIDYESGVVTSLEAAVRRNIMVGLGLMAEQISQQNHEDINADGWEISAHAMSAPDHEPIQGKQYTNDEYEKLNNSLNRRIGTLNCGHNSFPIILGVHKPIHSNEELQKFKQDNKKGVTVDGKHYTQYEATQRQRELELNIRGWDKKYKAAKATDDREYILQTQTNRTVAKQRYQEFSKKAGLRTQEERLFTVSNKSLNNTAGNGIIGTGDKSMGVDVQVDEFTPCLIERKTGKIFDTTVSKYDPTKSDYKGWNFDWSIPLREGHDVYALRLKDDDVIQGMVATSLDHKGQGVFLSLVEVAPHNYGNSGKYQGSGPHLFAFACKQAYDNGYYYVYFDSKTRLIEYYKKRLGATQIGNSQKMLIEDKSFIRLLNEYYGGDKNG